MNSTIVKTTFLDSTDGKWHFFVSENSSELSPAFNTREEADRARELYWILQAMNSNESNPKVEPTIP
jgi:hypothetical protein